MPIFSPSLHCPTLRCFDAALSVSSQDATHSSAICGAVTLFRVLRAEDLVGELLRREFPRPPCTGQPCVAMMQ